MEDFRIKEINYFLEYIEQDGILDGFLGTNYKLLGGCYIEQEDRRDCSFLDDYFNVLNLFYTSLFGLELKREKNSHGEYYLLNFE